MSLSDYQGDDFTYADVAHIIHHCHELFREHGIRRGDRIALCGIGSARWSVAFMAVMTYGAVAVPILTNFTPSQIANLVDHSESKLLFVSHAIDNTLGSFEMSQIRQRIIIDNLREPVSMSMNPEEIEYAAESSGESMCMINYTSGTTGNSKGVVLPYRAFIGNYESFLDNFGKVVKQGTPHLSILPLAHMYGLTLELICPFLSGCHVTFLGRLASPTVLVQALSQIRPRVLMSVPLVIDKLTKQKLIPMIKKSGLESASKWPIVGALVRSYLHHRLMKVLGGRVKHIVTGGAALNPSVSKLLLSYGFPLSEVYGATECAPLITVLMDKKNHPGTCGKSVKGMEIRIDSSDAANIPGEILTRGVNTMTGYYKNPQVTSEALDADGWYHTGDNGVIDSEGYLYIKGRKKNMLLGANGQNIYPEEIEQVLDTMLLVQESIVVKRNNGQLVALVHPDYKEARSLGLTDEHIENIMKLNTVDVNELVPSYEHIHHIEIHEEEFEKTAKRTIKRYLYK